MSTAGNYGSSVAITLVIGNKQSTMYLNVDELAENGGGGSSPPQAPSSNVYIANSFSLGGPYQLSPYKYVWVPPPSIVVSGLGQGVTVTATLSGKHLNDKAYIASNFEHEDPYPQGTSIQVKGSAGQLSRRMVTCPSPLA